MYVIVFLVVTLHFIKIFMSEYMLFTLKLAENYQKLVQHGFLDMPTYLHPNVFTRSPNVQNLSP